MNAEDAVIGVKHATVFVIGLVGGTIASLATAVPDAFQDMVDENYKKNWELARTTVCECVQMIDFSSFGAPSKVQIALERKGCVFLLGSSWFFHPQFDILLGKAVNGNMAWRYNPSTGQVDAGGRGPVRPCRVHSAR